MRRALAIASLFVVVSSVAGAQQRGDRPYDVNPERQSSQPGYFEPWLAPRYRSPRGLDKPPKPPRIEPPARRQAVTPPPLLVPETGRAFPNLPVTSGTGKGERESFHERAIRCTHQSGLYGPAAGDPGIYTRNCIHQ